MPDPSLPAVQQLEMLEGGPGAGNKSTAEMKMEASRAQLSDNSRKAHPSGMMREYSAFSIISKETAETRFENHGSQSSLVMAPQFKFGMQKAKGSPRQSPRKADPQ